MEENKASLTALLNAYYRGYHAANDSPKIFDDILAYQILTEDGRASLEQFTMTTLQKAGLSFPDQESALAWVAQATSSPALILSRAPYAENSLEKAVGQGVKQYVILGAGLDTFAFRRKELVKQLQVFEVDHPATQSYKRNRLAELGWEIPEQLHFVPVDFTKESLAEALKRSSYDPQSLTFFSWLGVTYYLTREEVFAALRDIAGIAPPGSTVIFDYLDTDAFIPRKAVPRIQFMMYSVQQVGEPMKAGFDPFKLAEELAPLGLRLNEDLSPMDIFMLYFMGRTDHYRPCEHAHFASVVVE